MTEDVQAVLDAGHQCNVGTEGYYWARLIVRTPPRHLPQPGAYPKLCAPSIVRLLLPAVGRPLVLSTEARGRIDLAEWIFLRRITDYADLGFTDTEVKALWNTPAAVQLVIDYYDAQTSEADAVGFPECIAYHEARQVVLGTHRNTVQVANGDAPGELRVDTTTYATPQAYAEIKRL